MSLHRGGHVARVPARREEVDGLLRREIDRGGQRGGLAARRAAGGGSAATSCATRSSACWRPATRRRRDRRVVVERLAHHPVIAGPVRSGRQPSLEAVVKGVFRVRPVSSIAARGVAAPLDGGGPCSRRAARRAMHLPRPPAIGHGRSRRPSGPSASWSGAPEPGTYLPFGGGVRRAPARRSPRWSCARCCGRCWRASRSRWRGRQRAHAPRLGDAAPVAQRDRLDRRSTIEACRCSAATTA